MGTKIYEPCSSNVSKKPFMIQEEKKLKTLLDWALYYRKLGWCILPAHNKRPLLDSWTEYQKRHPTDEEIKNWFANPKADGIAVVTGTISGVVILDIDEGADVTVTIVSQKSATGKDLMKLGRDLGFVKKLKNVNTLKALREVDSVFWPEDI